MPNRLAAETSPYLLQHANNPVDWFPWGEEAWARARAEDKPVLVSVGYAACHWCHVMERESFEDEAIAALQNDLVVSIKVDREERPDVDEIYMDAQQMLHGHGGWPLNVFCTPDGRPFFGGTYFPPQRRTGMPGWTDVLQGVTRAFREQRDQVEQQATELTKHLNLRVELAGEDLTESPAQIRSRSATALLQAADRTHGGFGGAPKFPQPFYLQLLVQQALDPSAGNRNDARRHLADSLRKMAEGGIYDQLAGGFHRYAVDEIWLVPHFEKMLYDNALLIPLYLDAHRLTNPQSSLPLSGGEMPKAEGGRDSLFTQIARETADYLLEGLQTPDGAFYASTDADSEGVEGRYFVWTRDELHELLDEQDAEIACRRWGVDVGGNWEGNSILLAAQSPEDVARWLNLPLAEVEASLAQSRQTLLDHRSTRIPPATDTKIIAAWNGMAIDALAKAGAVLEEPRFVDAAERAARFILDNMRPSSRRCRGQPAAHPLRRTGLGRGLCRGLRRRRRRNDLALRIDRQRVLVHRGAINDRRHDRALLGPRRRRILHRWPRRRATDRTAQTNPGRRNTQRQRARRPRPRADVRAHRRRPLRRPDRGDAHDLLRLPEQGADHARPLRLRRELAD